MPSMLPVNLLSLRSNCVSDDKLRSSLVREPVNSLKSRSMKTRLVSRPTSVGMVELSPPCSIPQRTKLFSNPISLAIVPMRLFSSVRKLREEFSELSKFAYISWRGRTRSKDLPNSIFVTHPSMLQVIPAQSHSVSELRKRSFPRKGRTVPQGSVARGFPEHSNQPSPFVEK